MSLDQESFRCGLELGFRAASVIAERQDANCHCIAAIRAEADKLNMFGTVKHETVTVAGDAEYQSWITELRAAAELRSWTPLP